MGEEEISQKIKHILSASASIRNLAMSGEKPDEDASQLKTALEYAKNRYVETEPADPMQAKRAELNRQYQAVVRNADAKPVDLLFAYLERSRAEMDLMNEEELLLGTDDASLMAKLVENRDTILQMAAEMSEIAVEIMPGMAQIFADSKKPTDPDKYRK